MKNEHGSVNVLLAAVIPFMLTVGAILIVVLLTMRADAKLKHLCRVRLLGAQEIAVDRLNKLIALNPEAQTLRTARSAAERAYLLAPDPETKLAAKLALEAIKAKQAIFGLEQRTLYREGQEASRLRPLELGRTLKATLARDQSRQTERTLAIDVQADIKAGAFDLIIQPQNSPTPNYDPAPTFTTTQFMSASWDFKLKAILPEWSLPLLGLFDERFTGSCAAGVEKGNPGWNARLKAAKR